MSTPLSGSYEDLAAQAQQYMRNNQYDQAQEIYERIYNRLSKMKSTILEKRPRLQELKVLSMRVLGDLAGHNGEHDRAIEFYTEGLKIDPDQQLEYQRAIAQMKIDRGDASTGLDELRAIVVANSGKADPWLWLGIELWSQGNNAEAIENLERVTEMSGVEAQSQSIAYSYLHDIYREEDRIAEAETAWIKAWEVTGSDVGDVSPLYQMYFEADNLPKAQEWLKNEKNPLRAGFYKGLFAQAEGSNKAAESAWRKTAKLNPLEQQEGHEAWAEAALRANFPPDRIAYALRDIAGKNQINIRGTILLAIAFARLGQAESTDFAIRNAVEINQRARPRRDLLSYGHWQLFDELVTDEEIKSQVRSYFETEAEAANTPNTVSETVTDEQETIASEPVTGEEEADSETE